MSVYRVSQLITNVNTRWVHLPLHIIETQYKYKKNKVQQYLFTVLRPVMKVNTTNSYFPLHITSKQCGVNNTKVLHSDKYTS